MSSTDAKHRQSSIAKNCIRLADFHTLIAAQSLSRCAPGEQSQLQ